MLSRIRSFGQTLTARQWAQAAGLVLLLVLLWWVGSLVHRSLTLRLIGTIVILLGAMAVLLAERARSARHARELERSLRGQSEDSLFGVRPERREQIEQIEAEFTAAVESLKRSKLGKGRRGQAALHALPWYVIMGPPASGKTTAIAESGLDFPFGTNRVRGIGGTRNCDWFFSTTAIFLDTAGRYARGDEDSDEWLKFLDLLKMHRRRTPVNGVIVAVSVDELLGYRQDELDRTAMDLRERIDELSERLGVRFPVYVVFTKADLIRGFTDFFADLTPNERRQPWGCTFRSDAQEVPRLQFDHEFNLLVQSLVNRRMLRLATTPPGAREAGEIFLFPLEFSSIGETLGRFVGHLFQPNPYRENPSFRGFYFTSALQEAVPQDRVLNEIGGRFDLSGSPRPTRAADSKSSFLGSLFTDIIIADRDRVSPTSRAASRRQTMRVAGQASILVSLVLFFWWVGNASAASSSDIRLVGRALRGTDHLASLDGLRPLDSALRVLEQSSSSSRRFGRMGLDRAGDHRPDLDLLFIERARSFLAQSIFDGIELRLRKVAPGDTSAERRGRAYDDLHAYLLLGTDLGHLQDSLDESFLKTYLRRTANGARPGDSVYTDRLVRTLASAERADPAHMMLSTDSTLIASVRRTLYTPPTLEGLYRQMRDEGARRIAPLTLERLVGPPAAVVFEKGPQVLGIYTKEGWEKFVQDAVAKRSREPTQTDWVLASQPGRLPGTLANPDSVAARLLDLYFADYVTQWTRLLASIRYVARDSAALIRLLDELQDSEKSPIGVLLDSVSVQTTFENGATRQVLEHFPSAKRFFATGNPVDHAFESIRQLRGKGRATLGQALGQYAEVGSKLQVSGVGSASNAGALKEAVASARVNVESRTKALDPDIRRAIFLQPLEIALGEIDTEAGGNLARVWRDQVCRPFTDRFAGLYPFSRSAQREAQITDVERFFRPDQAPIWQFQQKEVPDLRPPDFRPRSGQAALAVAGDVQRALRQARVIDDAVFDASGVIQLEFELTPLQPTVETDAEAPGPKPVATSMSITIDGQASDTYRMGQPSPKSFVWPSKADDHGARIVVTIDERQRKPPITVSIGAHGDWGWLRLLDSATVTRQPDGNYRVWWRSTQDGLAVHVGYLLHLRNNSSMEGVRSPWRFDCSSGG